MRNRILAGVAGILTAAAVVYVVEWFSHKLYPPPAGLDLSPEGMRAMLAQMPFGALLLVVLAWVLGALAGGLVARRIGGPGWHVLVVPAFVLLGIIMNVMTIPHPIWMVAAGILGTLVAGWFVSRPAAGLGTP